jgi:DNA segregation ATPase FtsK/SpoIIIE-like protein
MDNNLSLNDKLSLIFQKLEIIEKDISILKSQIVGTQDQQPDADMFFNQAVSVIVNAQKGSASYLQRKLGIGYNRAAKLLEEMEELGIVGGVNGSSPREVLINSMEEYQALVNE